MMVRLSILVPEGTINYIKNPALRYDTTDWNAQGSTITRTLTRARFGVASLKVVTNGAALNEGASFRVSALTGVNEPVTVSAYVRGAGMVRIRLDDNSVGGGEYASQAVELSDKRWTRLTMTGQSHGGNDLRLYVETSEASAMARTFYVDGAQLERKAYATSYCDGDQEGCRWNGIYHNSASQRPTGTRAGGRWVQLAGEQRAAEDLYMTVAGGLGMSPGVNNVQEYALQAGGYHQNFKNGMRPITLTFHAKHRVDDREDPVTLEFLHELRQMLIDTVKPDLTEGDEDIWFEYQDGPIPLYFRARYDGGLEGEWDVRNAFVNSFPLRLLAVSPLMEEDSQEAQELDFQDSLNSSYVLGRINGLWSRMNYGMNNRSFTLAVGPRGEVYAGGIYSVANNNASALSPLLTARISYWDGEKWVAIATSMGGTGHTYAIAVSPNGDVYAGGDFTSVNGVAANYIAKYTASTGTWSAMGTGMNGIVYDIKIAPNGDVYAVGAFTTAGGVNCYYIARWDGQWRRCGQYGGFSSYAYCLQISMDGSTLYAGGAFTREYGPAGATLNCVAQYNISAGTFSAMGSGFSGAGLMVTQVQTLYLSESNTLYAGGSFNASGSIDTLFVAQWQGGGWSSMGSGFLPNNLAIDNSVQKMIGMRNGTVIAVGTFNPTSGDARMNCVALWNGSTWFNLDVWIPFAGANIGVYSVAANQQNDDIFLAPNYSVNNVLFSGLTTVENVGTAQVSPVIYLKGPGRMLWIENQTTGKRLYLNLLMLSGEEITVDFGRGTIDSTLRNNQLNSLLAGSDFRSFHLIPGDNQIAVFMHDDVGARASIRYVPKHWSADATSDTESL